MMRSQRIRESFSGNEGTMPPNYKAYCGMSVFAMGLNEMRPVIHGVLPKTDSRNRPDMRALELGKVEDAEKAKKQLEAKQRKLGDLAAGLWFEQSGATGPTGARWVFNGRYWDAKKIQFGGIEFPDLW